GQPVVDTNGYVVGSVQQVTAGTATIVPITVGPDGVAVAVEDQLGIVLPQVNTNEMRLEMDAREPVFAGDRVITSSGSVRFPAGYPVGEVTADAAPGNDGLLSSGVSPFANPDTLRVVVVLAWPPDPVSAVAPEEWPESSTTTTSTTLDEEGTSTTSTTEGDG
ncbi:MAG: rod shape-determining protein MreC, partial [Acidimicrobiia bacterium]